MGHFNVIKGQYPSLSQLEETLLIKARETGIVRGTALVKDANTWRRGLTADGGTLTYGPGPVVYFALQAQEDPDVTMSKKITALPCLAPIRVETDQYDGTVVAGSEGKFLQVKNTGVVGLAVDYATACGIVTSAPTNRWSNNAGPYAGFPSPRLGERISVITFWCVYVPQVRVI